MVARLQLFNVHNGAPEGDYVLYADYERDIARLTAELEAANRDLGISREAIAEYLAEIEQLTAELAARQAFKDYVHKRLDDAGVPVDPPSPHRDAGCRIGGRLDWLFQHMNQLRQDRYDALSVKSKEGLLSSEWILRTGKSERRAKELTAELAASQEREQRLRETIKNYLDGNYPNPRTYRYQPWRKGERPGQCPHGTYYWDGCENCTDEYFNIALGEQESKDE